MSGTCVQLLQFAGVNTSAVKRSAPIAETTSHQRAPAIMSRSQPDQHDHPDDQQNCCHGQQPRSTLRAESLAVEQARASRAATGLARAAVERFALITLRLPIAGAVRLLASGSVILKLLPQPVSKSNTLSKSSRRSSLVLRIWPMRIRLNTISPKSPVDVHPPTLQHALGHVAVLLERIEANRLAQLLAGQMPLGFAACPLRRGRLVLFGSAGRSAPMPNCVVGVVQASKTKT